MPIAVADSFIVDKALDYAKLSDFAYAKWKQVNGQWEFVNDGTPAQVYYDKLWRSDLSKRYEIVTVEDDRTTDYQGIIFRAKGENPYCSSGTLILANRGMDTASDGLLAASIISNFNMPFEQFRSMVNFINENIGERHFEVTGHSLGGCLAQIAKAAYSDKVDEVYTYNALGALQLNKTYEYLCPSETPGKVIVWDKIIEYEWDRTIWEKYEAYFINRQTTGSSKIYNIAGSSDILASGGGPDIGSEVFIDGTHGIKGVIQNIEASPFYIDPRKPVTVIGSSRNEIFYGNYDSKHYSGNVSGSVTIVGGYGNDELWGDIGNDYLYGDLPSEPNAELGLRGSPAI